MGDEWPTLGQARARGDAVRFDDAGVPLVDGRSTIATRDAVASDQHEPVAKIPHDGRRQLLGTRAVVDGPSPRDGRSSSATRAAAAAEQVTPHGGGRGRWCVLHLALRHATPRTRVAWRRRAPFSSGASGRRRRVGPTTTLELLQRVGVMSYNVLADSHARAHPLLPR